MTTLFLLGSQPPQIVLKFQHWFQIRELYRAASLLGSGNRGSLFTKDTTPTLQYIQIFIIKPPRPASKFIINVCVYDRIRPLSRERIGSLEYWPVPAMPELSDGVWLSTGAESSSQLSSPCQSNRYCMPSQASITVHIMSRPSLSFN